MDPLQRFVILGSKQLILKEGVELLNQNKLELQRTTSSANLWGIVAIMANVTIIPLNIIVNTFELKAANSLYQLLVHTLYSQYGKSGARIDGVGKGILSALKKVINEELKKKALTEFVPGVNIMVGFVEDSLAAWQIVQKFSDGSQEIMGISRDLERKITILNDQIEQIGIRRAELLDQARRQMYTA